MNERIRQLAEQAFVINTDGKIGHVNNHMVETFADLIIRECIQISGPEDSYTDEWFKAKVNSVAKIKQYFGVE